ncbi:MAG: 16S rRNA (guanine(527)-N(7))-methyltransferase RsmG [Endomicrobium sp.]|jgi:16S rRNA (guanine527-N7)-methyltransferase|nr:16S rRNA (guanine(527)-N(7))-methyltransferase RsmG [Endomicrobium sp.]
MEQEILFNEFQNYVSKNILDFFSNKMCEKFKIYFYELIKWNNIFNLISFKSKRDIIYRHFCDSLYGAKVINDILMFHSSYISPNKKNLCNNCKFKKNILSNTSYVGNNGNGVGNLNKYNKIESNLNSLHTAQIKIADIGTGPGMPGIPIKIAFPEIKLTLVESITKKCNFLTNINKKLGFDIEILNKRAEELGQNSIYRQQYNFVLSRAVSKFSPNLEISIPLLKIGGSFIIYKTKNSIENSKEGLQSIKSALGHLGARLERTMFYKLPERQHEYCILVFVKYKDTQSKYPRKSGIPEKKPL